mgnify:FL=1
MSEFGIKIKNIEASTLYEYNNGVRDHYEYKDAMFTNSLFSDYLKDNGLKVWKEESTRDIICLEFNFGSRSYEEEIAHLKKVAIKARTEYKLAKSFKYQTQIQKKKNKRQKLSQLFREAQLNKDKYLKHTKEDIRTIFYNEGVNVEYITRKKNGDIIKRETIHYKMLYRSTGKAKKGSCMFICDRLYKKAIKFLYMGIKLPKKNSPIVEVSAYAPLISSAIVGKVKINPKNILILKDVDRYFDTKVVAVKTDENRQCYAEHINNYKLKNTLFDGQALIDSSIFPEWGNGYILLRHHFCKMAAFSTNIQQFFKDYFGDDYYSATVKDMFGNEHYVKDIELVTTDNAMKWLKFDISYEYWCERVYENNCMFGIVKTAHESKLGDVQRMSYQMVNCLDESIMENVVKESVEYVETLKQNDDEFLKYLEKNKNFSNDYEVLIALCEQNRDFLRSSYFRRRKRKIIENYVLNMKSGKLIQNAENLVVVGSPYAMLLYAATGEEDSVDDDDTFFVESGTIQCYTERFNSGEHLAFFRSPFNSQNNLTYLHNTYHKKLDKYFNLGRQCIAINMNGTDAQDRNNGMDMDSDSGYTTNQPDIVQHAKKCYLDHPTIVNLIPRDSKKYNRAMDAYALIDNNLANSQLDIGLSSNLAQIARTYSCNFDDEKYVDYVCILSVLAQVAIDNAKRRFDIDLGDEIKRIQNDMNIKTNLYPSFWLLIKKNFKKDNINEELKCPMNYLYNLDLSEFHNSTSTLPMSHFFNKFEMSNNIRTCRKVEDLIAKYSLNLYDINSRDSEDNDYLLLRKDFDNLILDIQKIKISKNYLGLFSWMIDRAFKILPGSLRNQKSISSVLNRNKPLLLKTLYEVNSSNLLKCFSKNC